MKYLTHISVFIAGLILAFFVCANFNLNPFGGIHGTGSSDTVYIPKTITVEIPSVTAPVLHGKPLNESQRLSLNRSRLISVIDTVYYDSSKGYSEPCPSFAIDTSLAWRTSERITLADTSFVAKDSGSYNFKFIVDCLFGRVIDFSFDGTPLHPIIIEKQITNTITIVKPFMLAGFGKYDWLNKDYRIGIEASYRLGAFIPMADVSYSDSLSSCIGAKAIIIED